MIVLATLFTSFLSIKLVRLADRMEDRKLPVPMCFILDEFPNIGVIPDFKKKLATARSRGIGMSIIFQNIPQMMNRYPEGQWEEILGGCDMSLFLGCNDMTTATYYSSPFWRDYGFRCIYAKKLLYYTHDRLCAGIRRDFFRRKKNAAAS